MSFQKKVFLYIAILFTLTLAVTSGLTSAIIGIQESQAQLNHNYYHQMILAERAQSLLSVQLALIPSFVLNANSIELVRFRKAHDRFRETLTELRSELSDPHEVSELDSLLALDTVTLDLAERGIDMRMSGASPESVDDYFKDNTFSKTERLNAGLNHLLSVKTAELTLAREQMQRSEARLLVIIVFTGITVVLLFVSIAGLLWRAVCQQARESELREALLTHQEHLANARKEIVEVVSHDLKSPLATLYMNLQTAKEELDAGTFSERETLESMAMALRSVKTMDSLVNQLLDHSKIEAGGFVEEASMIDAKELLEQHIQQLQLLARDKNVKIETHIPERIPPLPFDETRFLQVLSNLTSNAMKFVNHQGKITLSAKKVDDTFQIAIRNTGATMRQEDLEHIFERYWQARKTARNGTGLGLSIVKGIMEAYGGSVTAENRSGDSIEFTLIFRLQNLDLFHELPPSQGPGAEPATI